MRLVLAASTGIAGSLTTAAVAAGNVVGQVAQNAGSSDGFPVGQALTAGGSVTVAGVLFWIVLGFRAGQIIAREPAQVAAELAGLVKAGEAREEALGKLITDAEQRAADYRTLLLAQHGGTST